jgi:hypothetical protein
MGRVRAVRTDAWLRRIRISPTSLDVWVAGEARDGARVEVNSADWRASKPVGKTGRVRFRLPRGLPDDAFLYLNRGRDWLDYRALGSRLYGSPDLGSQGVEVEIPDDPQTEIEALLSRGEGPYIEYKRQLPDNTTESKRKVLKTIAAFANGEGGHVVFGMDPDELTVHGLGDQPLQIARDRLGNLIRAMSCPPTPRTTFALRPSTARLWSTLKSSRVPAARMARDFKTSPLSSTSAAGQVPTLPRRKRSGRWSRPLSPRLAAFPLTEAVAFARIWRSDSGTGNGSVPWPP